MKNMEERGPVGRWLFHARKAAGVRNVPEAVALVEERTGVHIIESTYTQYEGGSRELKKAEHRAALEQVWGPQPAETQQDAPTSTSELGALVAHLKEQDRRIDQLLALVERLTATPPAPATQEPFGLDLSRVEGPTQDEVRNTLRGIEARTRAVAESTRSPRP